MTKQREYSYDSIKGILIILVIWGHWLEYGLSDSINLRLFNTIYLFHMPLFIAISPLLWIGMYMVRRYTLPLSFLPIIGYTMITVLSLFFMSKYNVFHKVPHPYSFITKFF